MDDTGVLRANLMKAIRTLFWMHFFSAVLVPFYTDGAHLNLTQVFLLNSWFMLWYSALQKPADALVDYLGAKWSISLAATIGIFAGLLFASQMSFLNFLFGGAMFAASYAVFLNADRKMVRAMGTPLSDINVFKNGGTLVGALIGGFVAARYGLAAPLVAYAIPAGVALALSLALVEPTDIEGESSPGYEEIVRQGLRLLQNNRTMFFILAETAAISALMWSLFWLFPPLLEMAGVPIQYFGLIYALGLGAQILLIKSAKQIESWVGSRRLLLQTCSFLTALAFIDLAYVDSKLLVALAIVVGFAFSAPREVLLDEYLSQKLPEGERAAAQVLASHLRTFAIVVINPIIGLLADWNLWRTMLILGVIIGVGAVASQVKEEHLAIKQ